MGNQLLAITDLGDQELLFNDGNTLGNDYSYDANGNLAQDQNKAIDTLAYNALNLPQSIEFVDADRMDYLYDAVGIKLRQTVNTTKTTDYCGSFVYENGVLKYIIFSEGNYVVGDNNYEYHIKDHLGNVRVAFFDNDTIVQRNDYYPFGMSIAENSYQKLAGNCKNSYLYNGKEFQGDLGLGWHDYGARLYDADFDFLQKSSNFAL